MRELKPYAAISGTFYAPNLKPLGDIVTDGKLVNKGRYPNAIAVTDDGQVLFVRRAGPRFDWRGYRAAIAAGPKLVTKGEVDLDPVRDGFSEMGLAAAATRSGVGLTRSGELLLVVSTEPVNLSEFAEAMLDLGVVEALNLDGGPACALYHKGRVIVRPDLRLTNLLLVYKKR